ncbi:hypothetical protein GobsT_63560 [Gemmata obscuriglobus]|uniref:Uncharacterized protein n=1 Tax=Gemmata obscuriglobus TaxID=114 RepID=A0A2Z3GTP5_9BACT|nr:hypothetical protein [Gemmata obscuriglobus]AWM35911.1 hypothetical protein C1280_02050 [Gemmata obscuriglobus]QEG31534.1 hypothetical protein GobsT_63560 [Gemmata obscuriglobus]VTS10876.1 Uncharacterized protein OS=Blastopirellula marina DSM 3645 GN=DSM3645_28797 PE=4 SV=1 [Gemmata obscuriglobus UQM 2246]
MIVRYGSYQHDDGECAVAVDQQALENDAGQYYARRVTWTISGQLQADTAAALAVKMVQLERAYAVWYRDLVLADGPTVVWQLPNAGSTTGVKIVKPPSYPSGAGAQLTTFVDYSIVATADYPAGGGENLLRSFTETLAFSGGGPRRTVVECANAPPQEQVLALYTAFRATQIGQAVGLTGYPTPPAPLWPGKLEVDGEPTLGSPRLRNGVYVDWPVSWAYRFVSATPLAGVPNRWPAG